MSTTIHLRHGDCVEVLADMPEGSVGGIVCDPPYGLEFMGKEWDRLDGVGTGGARFTSDGMNKGFKALPSYSGSPNPLCQNCKGSKRGRDRVGFKVCRCNAPKFPNIGKEQGAGMQEWHRVWLVECYRVIVPGGIIKAFSGSRTAHRLAAAMREAGFTDIRLEAWSYGSGFPKSLDVSKAIDKHGGVPQNVIRIKNILREAHRTSGRTLQELNEVCGFEASGYLRGSSTWTFVLPSQEKWVVLRDALSLPNTLDVSFAKAEREVLAQKKWSNSAAHFVPGADHTRRVQLNVTAPATDAARRWDGWGTALKPSWEPVIVGTKPA